MANYMKTNWEKMAKELSAELNKKKNDLLKEKRETTSLKSRLERMKEHYVEAVAENKLLQDKYDDQSGVLLRTINDREIFRSYVREEFNRQLKIIGTSSYYSPDAMVRGIVAVVQKAELFSLEVKK